MSRTRQHRNAIDDILDYILKVRRYSLLGLGDRRTLSF